MRRPIPAIEASWPRFYPAHLPVGGAVSRALDREAVALGTTSFALMEHASMGVASVALALLGGTPAMATASRIVVLCGPGNNGGDGYGAARFLHSWGARVTVLRASPRTPQGDGDAAREAALSGDVLEVQDAWRDRRRVPAALRGADLVVDALFGVGLVRDLQDPYAAWIGEVNAADALRLAVDVPSGLDADTGEIRGVAVRADVTATMAMPKTGLRAEGPGRAHAGHVVEIDIGLPRAVHAPFLA